MGQPASQAAAFYKDVSKSGKLWTCKDDGGNPAPKTSSGKRAMPFWSSLSRVEKIIKNVPAYSKFEPQEVSWEDFETKWAPDLQEHGLLIGVNWSGARATGYDLEPNDVLANVNHQRHQNT
ncbi:DUF2750 domain-containing protein [Agarivorans sp. B2Z047]|uniref:DUF2750 domain-containing protein n=2 Tax=unclassified Agarivorans TaxID=2636026 RepID=UPI00128C28B9|nr:DUF2750 domain-containing protein [Agarivorans sp. B2Z047]MPW30751.1 DUF2750 domain-containing protein [Agarivorans sp. B2Z047]UQN42026.1 DUF2750 domain-containing protein [Agarivorans sp. B2Z047]